MRDIMVDLETLGTKQRPIVTSIGAVKFDENGLSEEEFSVNLKFQDQITRGHVVEESTIRWWMRQSDDAREEFQKDGLPTPVALDEFSKYVTNDGEINEKSIRMWGNGAAFDNVLLKELYFTFQKDVPWCFWNDRCYRTRKNAFLDVRIENLDVERTAHVAVDDARIQAVHLLEIINTHNINLR